MLLRVITLVLIVCTINGHIIKNGDHDSKTSVDEECNLSSELKAEIASYAPVVQTIIDSAISGNFQNRTYDELALFIDKFGNRISGSQSLENAIDYMIDKSIDAGLDNVHGEEATVPHWVRGEESAVLLKPRSKSLNILGLGNSVGTPGILAEVVVVNSFDDLQEKADLAKGRIVVYNINFTTYFDTIIYRSQGATEAAKVGALASLLRSLTDFSLNTPHTGLQSYAENVTKIPAACITVEDAHLLQRLQDEGETINILLKMDDQSLPDAISRNTIAEIEGSEEPDKVVVVSGHIDSWDVGEGAMDDGGGIFISWGSLLLLKELGLTPKRTIRAILWTAEEFGYFGAYAYAEAHANETDNFMFLMESDFGTFTPVGLDYSASATGSCVLKEIMQLLAPINATEMRQTTQAFSDIEVLTGNGIPGASLATENDRYFWYHHTPADTLDAESSEALDKNTALFAAVAYVIADMSIDFPREDNVKTKL